VENDSYSTPGTSVHRRHINGDHSRCKNENHNGDACPVREQIERDCKEFLIQSLAADIPEDTIYESAKITFPDWVVDYWWLPTHETLRMESHYVL
jgi:hypothetical protein